MELAKQVSEEDLRAAQQLFGMVDANHDGAISQDELAKVMLAANVNASPADVAALFAQLDTNHDGSISLSEFVTGMKRLHKAVEVSGRLTDTVRRQQAADPRAAHYAQLEDHNGILMRYLRENFVEKCLRKTEELLLQEHDIKGAKAMLELLDMPRLTKLEEFVGPVMPADAAAKYQQLLQRLTASLSPISK